MEEALPASAAAVEPPLVGRDREVALLDAALDRLGDGTFGCVLVEGEGGVGKTRLVAEVVDRALDRGTRVYRGRAEELERHRPFGPLADAFGCARTSPVAECAAIGRLLYPDDTEPATGPAVQFRVVEAFVDLAQVLAQQGPLVVAIDDLQWADSSTLLALRSFAKRLSHQPVLVLATLRPLPRGEDLAAFVPASVDGGATHLRLAPLAEPAVTDLAAALLHEAPGPRLREVLARAGGNPLFVTELVRSFPAGAPDDALPATLRTTVLRRLTSLSATALEALRLASVIGARFSLAELVAVSGRSALELLPAVEELVRAGLLGDAGTDLVFRHDLVRDAVYQDLPAAVRGELHREVGRSFAEAGTAAERVATHLALAATGPDPQASEWLERAAREIATRAPAEAADFYEQAIGLLPAGEPHRDEILVELIQVTMWAGRIVAATRLARTALERPHPPGVEGALRLWLGRGLLFLGRPEEAVGFCETSGDGLPTRERIQLRADAALARMMMGDLDGADRRAHEALAMHPVRREDVTVAVSAMANVAMYRGDLHTAIDLGSDVLDRVSNRAYPGIPHYPAHYFLSLCLICADRLDEAERVLAEGRLAGEELGNVATLPQLHWAAAARGYFAGRWDDAVVDAETGMLLVADGGTHQGARFAYAVSALVALHRGDLDEAGRILALAEAEPVLSLWAGWPAWAAALLHEARGDAAAALRALEETWAHAREVGLVSEYPVWAPDLVRLLVASGATGRANDVCVALDDAARRMDVPYAQGAALLGRALLGGDADAARGAVAAYRKSARVFERARVEEQAAAVLAAAGARAEAVALLEAATATYDSLGARAASTRAASALRGLGVRRGARGERGRPTTGWDALTPTELTVARLIAQGLTNKQMAQRLFVSPRTVETHVAHLLAKLALTARGELIAQAARRFGDE